MTGPFAAVEASVARANAQLERMVVLTNGVDPAGYERMGQAAAFNAKMFRNAAASTGMFEVEQLKLNRATDDYTKKLKQQKIGFREWRKQSELARRAYREQLQLQNMSVMARRTGALHGKQVMDVVVPTEVSKELDTAGRRLAWFNEHVKSGARQMVNWGKNTQWAGRQLMVGFTIPIIAAGAAAGVLAYQIDKQLTRIAKVYNTTANSNIQTEQAQMAVTKELNELRINGLKTATQAAHDYGSSATDTLEVQAALAAAGKQGVELQRATGETMRIMRLGEIDSEAAIKSTIALQAVFKMSTDELTESFNYMNAVENQTSLETADFAQAIPIAANVVQSFGGDIQELGTLLVAMKERGIDAVQGANALKAAMQRLGRPSKQVQEEFTAITGQSITQIFEDSTGLLDLFGRINDATANLGNKDKIRVFAGLFGSYQVTRMSALVEQMDNLNDSTTQVGTAFNLAGQETKQWANIAEQEMKRYQESVSGRWDTAFQEMKIQLSTLGEPFVQIATVVVSGISSIIDKFNELPKGVKVVIAAFIGLAAIAGPLVMLTGLFANLLGNALLFGGAIVGLGVKMKILDRSSQAAVLASELASKGYTSERTAAQMLRMELNKLVLAQERANEATFRANMPGANMNKPFIGPLSSGQAATANGYFTPATAKAAETMTAETKRQSRFMKATAASAGVFAAGMALSMVTTNGTAQNIANMAMLGAVIVPAAEVLVPLLKSAAIWSWATSKGLGASAIAAGRARLAAGGMFAAIRAGGAGLAALVSPVGLIAGGIALVGYGLFKWKQHLDEVRKENERVRQSVMDMTETWAEQVGKVEKKYKDMAIAQSVAADQSRDARLYETYTTGDLKQTTQDYKTLGDSENPSAETAEQAAASLKHFTDLQVKFGLTTEQAKRQLMAMYAAAGLGADEAARRVRDLAKDYSDLSDQANLGKYLQLKIDTFVDAEAGSKEASDAGKEAADAFTRAFAGANSTQAKDLIDQMSNSVYSQWQVTYERLNVEIPGLFEDLGINSGKEFRDAITAAGGHDAFIKDTIVSQFGQPGGTIFETLPGTLTEFKTSIQGGIDAEKQFVGAITAGDSSIGRAMSNSINTLGDFTNEWIIQSKQWDMNEANEAVRRLKVNVDQVTRNVNYDGPKALPKAYLDAEKASALVKLNQLLLNHGLATGNTYAEALHNWMKQIPDDVARAATQVRIANSATSNWITTVDQLRGAFGSVTSDIAGAISEGFDTRMNNAIDSRQAYWDARAKNLSAAMDKRGAGLDAAWQRREDSAQKYWDARVKAVEDQIDAEEKAEEKRKAMFEAEIARIERLNDIANRNIDFNVAINSGNLDEAAKISNDSMAEEATFALNKAAEAGAKKSAKRIDKLQNRQDHLEEARDKFMDDLQKREEAAKAHFQNMQQMAEDQLQAQADADMEATRKDWENKKKHEDDLLELFQSTTYKNRKQVLDALKTLGLDYTDFAKTTGETVGGFFDERLRFYLTKAAKEAKDDAAWEALGKDVSDKVLQGMGFESLAQFKEFITKGTMTPVGHSHGDDRDRPHHKGGEIGPVGGSGRLGRRGKNRPDEVNVLAQIGEFMVDRKTMRSPVGDTIRNLADAKGGGAYGYGLAGKAGAVGAWAIAKGVGKMMGNAAKTKKGAVDAGYGTDSGTPGGGYIAGAGGRHVVVNGGVLAQGIHEGNAIDIGIGIGNPVYAVADGKVTGSYDIPGYESRRMLYGQTGPGVQDGLRSYGRVVTIDHGGFSSLMAHLSSRSVGAGATIKGGSVVGYSGNAGNVQSSSGNGAHVHFGVPGGSPYDFWPQLQKGASNINVPGLFNLHKNEAVLTEDLNKKYHQGMDNWADGPGGDAYDVKIIVNGENKSVHQIADEVMNRFERKARRKPRSRRSKD